MQNTTIITKPVAVIYTIIILMFSIFKYAETYDNSGDTTIALLGALTLFFFWIGIGYVFLIWAKIFIKKFLEADYPSSYVMPNTISDIDESENDPKSEPIKNMKEEKAEIERKKREDGKRKLDEIISWVNVTFEEKLSESNLKILIDNIRTFATDNEAKHTYTNIKAKINGVTNTDLNHLGWIIGKRLGKMNIPIAAFLKETFSGMLANVEMTTIAAKLTNTDGKYSLRIIKPDEDLVPHVFPTGV
jgi:hypothetical protein